MNEIKLIQPQHWPRPKGYANGVIASGRQLYIAGQIGWNARGEFETDDLVRQIEQALQNVVEVLAAAGGSPKNIVRLNWYVTEKNEYASRQAEIGEAYRRVLGRHFPAMTLLVVAGLLESRAKVEIEATAVLPV